MTLESRGVLCDSVVLPHMLHALKDARVLPAAVWALASVFQVRCPLSLFEYPLVLLFLSYCSTVCLSPSKNQGLNLELILCSLLCFGSGCPPCRLGDPSVPRSCSELLPSLHRCPRSHVEVLAGCRAGVAGEAGGLM